jgi:hypothetical protein
MGIVAAYNMYQECCEGLMDPTWDINEKERMSYSELCQKLSTQMLEYNPKNNFYDGDDKLLQNHKGRRSINK